MLQLENAEARVAELATRAAAAARRAAELERRVAELERSLSEHDAQLRSCLEAPPVERRNGRLLVRCVAVVPHGERGSGSWVRFMLDWQSPIQRRHVDASVVTRC